MNKTWLVIQREYKVRVKKRSFLITTILVPLIIIAFYAAIIAISVNGSSDVQKVAILDEANLFNGKIDASKKDNSQYTFISGQSEQSYKSMYKAKGFDAFLYIPKLDLNKPEGIKIHSQSAYSVSAKARLENTVDKAIETKRMQAANIDPKEYEAINADIYIENKIDSKEGEKTSVAGVAYGVSFACGILIYMMMIIYGTQVMRGVMEEKTNRIAEVIVSSVKPFQLMLGKIIGIGAVGLTQFAIWIILLITLQLSLPLIFPDLFHHVAEQAGNGAVPANTGMMMTITEGLGSIPFGKILFAFIFYFLGGYLTYASLFAAIGSTISEDQQDAQQLVFPVMMPIILGFVIMTKAINDPNSSLAIFGSLFPLTSPIVMMGRITYDIPAWQLVCSMALLILGFLFFAWLTGKIYRTGILMYGKKAGWKEMAKWAFRKD